MSNRDVVFNVVKFLTTTELVEVSEVNKTFYKFSRKKLKIQPREALLLQNTFNRMKFFLVISRKLKRKRVNSWKRKRVHPDNRFIF